MEAFVVETPVGVFVLDQRTDVLEKVLFPSQPRDAAAELKQIQEGRLTQPVIDALKRAAAKYSPLVFEDETLAKDAQNQAGLTVSIRATDAATEFRRRLSSEWKGRESWIKKQSLELPVLKTPSAYNNFAREVTLELARVGIARAAAKRDLSAVQAVRAMDDLDKTLNLLA